MSTARLVLNSHMVLAVWHTISPPPHSCLAFLFVSFPFKFRAHRVVFFCFLVFMCAALFFLLFVLSSVSVFLLFILPFFPGFFFSHVFFLLPSIFFRFSCVFLICFFFSFFGGCHLESRRRATGVTGLLAALRKRSADVMQPPSKHDELLRWARWWFLAVVVVIVVGGDANASQSTTSTSGKRAGAALHVVVAVVVIVMSCKQYELFPWACGWCCICCIGGPVMVVTRW